MQGAGSDHPVSPDTDPGRHGRIPPLPEAEWTDAARAVFAFWGEPESWDKGSGSNMVMVLAHHPALAMAYYTFGKHLLIESTLPARSRELVVMRIAWRLRSHYEWHYHVGYAVRIGITPDEIAAIRIGAEAENWDAPDRAVLRAVDELHEDARLSDATWAALSAHLDRRQIMDLMFTIGNYVTLSWAIAALGIELEDGIEPIAFDLAASSERAPRARFMPGEVDDWTMRDA